MVDVPLADILDAVVIVHCLVTSTPLGCSSFSRDIKVGIDVMLKRGPISVYLLVAHWAGRHGVVVLLMIVRKMSVISTVWGTEYWKSCWTRKLIAVVPPG